MSFSESAFIVSVLLVAAWWSFWGAAGAVVRVRAEASPRLGFALGILGPIGLIATMVSVSQKTVPFVEEFPSIEVEHIPGPEGSSASLPPLPD